VKAICVPIFIGDAPQFSDQHRDTLTNPTLIVEVLSKSTTDYDRGEKFEQYRTLKSFNADFHGAKLCNIAG